MRSEKTNNYFKDEPFVCLASDIGPMLRGYIERREGERDPLARTQVHGRSRKKGEEFGTQLFVSERITLATEAGTSVRTLSRIMEGEQKWVGYALAEMLLVTSMGRPDLMRHLRFVPNPLWSTARWVEWRQGCETD